MLIVPGAHRSPAPSGAAANVGHPTPTVATTSTPPSCALVAVRTSTAVIIPTTPSPRTPQAASQSTGPSAKDEPTVRLATSRRGPNPPPTTALDSAIVPGGNVTRSSGDLRPPGSVTIHIVVRRSDGAGTSGG